MNNNHIFLINPQFDIQQSTNYNLLVSLSESSFSFAIKDPENGDIMALYDVQNCSNVVASLQDCMASYAHLNVEYRSVKVSFYSENELLIPLELELQDVDLKAFVPSMHSKIIHSAPALGIESTFDISSDLEKQIKSGILAGAKKYHQIAPMLKLADKPGLYINFTGSSAHFVYIISNELVFQNTYSIATADELNYFVLLTLSLLKIDPQATESYISGIINKDDPNYSVLKKYFKNVNFKLPLNANEDSILSNLPLHYFSALLAIDLCE